MKLRKPPPIGARITLDYGPENSNTWRTSALVRGVVDGHLVVRLYGQVAGNMEFYYKLISPESWTILPYRIGSARRAPKRSES